MIFALKYGFWETFLDYLCRRDFVIFCKSLAFIFLYTLAKNLVLHDLVHHLPHLVGMVELVNVHGGEVHYFLKTRNHSV